MTIYRKLIEIQRNIDKLITDEEYARISVAVTSDLFSDDIINQIRPELPEIEILESTALLNVNFKEFIKATTNSADDLILSPDEFHTKFQDRLEEILEEAAKDDYKDINNLLDIANGVLINLIANEEKLNSKNLLRNIRTKQTHQIIDMVHNIIHSFLYSYLKEKNAEIINNAGVSTTLTYNAANIGLLRHQIKTPDYDDD